MDNQNIPKSTPKDVFLHLFSIVTFYLSVISFITLYLQYINVLFPDALNFYYRGVSQSIFWATSILVISVPFYLLSTWLLSKDYHRSPLHREISMRKWLVYLTLFASALTVIIDLMTLVYNFLNGELNIRFFLKILVVLIVAAVVFAYYFWDLKNKEVNSKLAKTFAWILVVVVLASVVWGFFIVGTPSQQRSRRFDEQRVQNLQETQSQILNYWMKKEMLPASLSDLEDSLSGFKVSSDPETGKIYDYQITGDLSFQLCAEFETSSSDFPSMEENMRYYDPYTYSLGQNWDHAAEKTCFERTIDPDLYKQEMIKQ